MDDMNAFERQVADRLQHHAGPTSPVDDLAVFEAVVAANQSRRWGFTVFSALKFIAASIIVALFGGLLLAGVLTQPTVNESVPGAITGSPSPTATYAEPSRPATGPEGLPGSIVTEEVEPGVYRVVSDGRLDLTQSKMPGWDVVRTVIGPDGSAWMFGPESFFRLGSEGDVRDWPVRRPSDTGIAANGDIWATYPGVIRVFDGRDWTTRTVDVTADRLEFAPDGKVWAQIWDEDKQAAVVGWFGPDGAAFVPAREEAATDGSNTDVAGAQVGLASGGAWSVRNDGTLELYRWAAGEWETMPSPPEPGYGVLEIGPDGTVWMVRCPSPGCWGPWANRELVTLARLEGGEWQVSARTEPTLALWGIERVGPDGAMWGLASPRDDDTCSGIVRFDGVVSTRWLDGHCIEAIEIGQDGSAWVQAYGRSTLEGTDKTDDGAVETYVITPEATDQLGRGHVLWPA